MTLPELPKLHKKKEANAGLKFRAWIEKNPQISGAFELKQCTDSLPFDAVTEHQIAALLKTKRDALLYKAPDDSRGLKPYDYFYIRKGCAFVVIKFKRSFECIDIDTFILEKKRSQRKSLTYQRAKEISSISIP